MPSTINANNTTGLVSTADTSGVLQLQTNGTTAVTVDASQNVGVGVTPSAWNAIFKSIDIGTTASFAGSSGGANVFNNAYWSGSDYIYKTTAAATRYLQSSGEHYWYRAASGTAGNAISFTQAMTLDASGNLLVGTTTSGGSDGGFEYRATSENGGFVLVRKNSSSVNGDLLVLFSRAGVTRGTITMSGTTAVAYNTTSDYRLKENMQPMTGALSRVAALKPCTYTWKSAPNEIGEGFIAHELAEVCPQAVTGEKDAVNEDGSIKPQSIDTSFLVATLTAAIQEQQALITQLQADVAALKGASV
jgi:hypothetical protein